ncbi:AAA family ATPase [Bacillus sp. FJAT-45037]|uniref:AAA family ATPase n=1 Tax=Bacillus sp. FJAT-45037 TaxID=2011007 RepID=UPI000C239060|nr:AAA family ATPase [Bacillus sp. FJAT-45037]
MNKFESVRLENFQSHLDTTIELNKGLNVLVGQSDSGKTAIIRALKWLLYNQPRGTDFIRVGADFVRVTVQLSNGIQITRERTSSKNRYIIREDQKDDLVLEGFGIHVPDEVLKAHGMRPLRIDRDHELAIHLSGQLDGPFLLEQTSSLRAKTIGRISGAHYLDMAIRDTSKDLSGLTQRVKLEEGELDQLTSELEPFESLDKQRAELDRGEEALQVLREKHELLNRFKQQKERVHKLQLEKDETEKTYRLVEKIEDWNMKFEAIKQTFSYAKLLQHKLDSLNEFSKSIELCRKWIQKTANVDRAALNYEHIQSSLIQKNKLIKWQQYQLSHTQQMDIVKKQLHQTDFVKQTDWRVLDQIKDQSQLASELQQLKIKYSQVTEAHRRTVDIYERVKQTDRLEEKRERLEQALLKHKALRKVKEQLEDVTSRLSEGSKFIEKQTKEQEHLETEFDAALKHIGQCPTCGNKITS